MTQTSAVTIIIRATPSTLSNSSLEMERILRNTDWQRVLSGETVRYKVENNFGAVVDVVTVERQREADAMAVAS